MQKIIKKYQNSFFILFLFLFSLIFNFYYGYRGIFPIDSFLIFDSGYNVLNGLHPFKDYWSITGPLLDYFQAFFFLIFGVNWFSYVLHASILNLILVIFSYFIFISLGLKRAYSFIYCLGISVLAYPSIGTPFIDHHSVIFSILATYFYILFIKNKKNIFLFFVPIFLIFAFLSKQTPSSYIIIFISILFLIDTIYKFEFKKIFFLILGIVFPITIIFLNFKINSIPFDNFLVQYFFYPLSIGSSRLENLNPGFKELILQFKYIYICLIPLLFIFVLKIFSKEKKQNEKDNLLIIFLVIGTTFILIYSQLLTRNQILIFFLIPIVTAFSQIYYEHYIKDKIFIYLIIVICFFSITKYHFRYNQEKKFMELSGVDISKSVNAGEIHPMFNNLKWITLFYPKNPEKEIQHLIEIKNYMNSDTRNKIVVTDYQFFSALLDLKFNSPNKWYDDLSIPTYNNKYFKKYKNFFITKLKKNKIEVIYIIGLKKFNFLKNLINVEECILDKRINEMLLIYDITNCKL